MAEEEAPGTPLLRDAAPSAHEIARLAFEASKSGMRVLNKTHDATWRDARTTGNLDHVVAAQHLDTSFAGKEVAVGGWPERPQEPQLEWVANHSDHALLYFEVQEV